MSVDGGESLEGSVVSSNMPSSSEYSIAGGPAKHASLIKAADGTWRFKVSLDRGLPYGFAPIVLRVKDAAGNGFEATALLYVTDYAIAREETGFRFRILASAPTAVWSSAPRPGAARKRYPPPVLGAFYGGELTGLRFVPPTDLVTAGYDGRVVTLATAKDGTSAPTRLVGTTAKGHEFSAGPFIFVTDSTPPTITIDSPAEGTWFNGKMSVTGKASDAAGAVTLGWRRLPDGPTVAATTKNDGSFSIELSAGDVPAGSFLDRDRGEDAGGKRSDSLPQPRRGRDAAGPAIPVARAGPGGLASRDVAAAIDDASGIASVEYAADGASFSAIDWTSRYFVHRADLAANPKAAYRVVDRAGNVAVSRPEVVAGSPPARLPASASVSVEPAAGEAKSSSRARPGLSRSLYCCPASRGPITARWAMPQPLLPRASRIDSSCRARSRSRAWPPWTARRSWFR